MGIIEDYLSGNTASIAPKSGGIIDQYLNNDPEKVTAKTVIDKLPSPPISGVSASESEVLNKREPTPGNENPRPGISSIPVKAGVKTWEAFKEAGLEAGQGIGEVLSKKPATGAGNIAMGLMGLVTSPWEGAKSVATDLTGNETFGNKVGLGVVGAAPIKALAPYSPLRIPTIANPNPLVNPITKPSKSRALRDLVDDITSDGRDPQALVNTVNAMKADPRIGPADMSPAVLDATQKLFQKEGAAAKNYLHETSKNRLSNLGADTKTAFDEAGGIPVNVVTKLDELVAASRKVGDELINPVLKSAGPVNVNKTLEAIDSVLKPGVMSKISGESGLPLNAVKAELANIRKYLSNNKEMRTDAEDLNKFQSGLRVTGERLLRKGGADAELGHALLNVRTNLVNDIDSSAKGYKEGLSRYRDEMHIKDAFGDAYNGVFSNSTKMENRPEFTEKWFKGLTDHEKDAAREGARLAIDSRMGVAQNPSLAGTNIGRSDFNQKKLEIIFGKEETEKLLQNLEFTRAIKNSDQKIIEGSQTAARIAADKKSDIPVKPDVNPINKYVFPLAAAGAETMTGGTGMATLATGALAVGTKVVSAAAHKAKVALQQERNLQSAKLALPVEGPDRDLLIKQLEAFIPGPKQSIVTRGANTLSRLVSP